MFNIKLSIERKIKQLKRQQALQALSKSPSIDAIGDSTQYTMESVANLGRE